jgi:hypothetical protein
MNVYYLAPSRSRRIEVLDPPVIDWQEKPIDEVAPLVTRELWLYETIYDGRFMLAVYDRKTDTMYLREPSEEDIAQRRASFEP